jgi:hypothetical protein
VLRQIADAIEQREGVKGVAAALIGANPATRRDEETVR